MLSFRVATDILMKPGGWKLDSRDESVKQRALRRESPIARAGVRFP